MQTTMSRCNARAQAFKAVPKASLKASAPAHFAGLRRSNVLDVAAGVEAPLSVVSSAGRPGPPAGPPAAPQRSSSLGRDAGC